MTGFLTENSVEIGIFIGVMFILGVLKAWLHSTRANDIIFGYSRYSECTVNKKKTKLRNNSIKINSLKKIDNQNEYGLKQGYFFRSDRYFGNEYFILINSEKGTNNAIVSIYKLVYLESEQTKTGEIILMNPDTGDMNFICTLHLYGKYFFPKFSEELQFYYNDEKEGELYRSGDIDSLCDVMNFALNVGLKDSKITPY